MRKILFLVVLSFSIHAFGAKLIPLNSEQGGKMLASSILNGHASQFLSEIRYFTYQENIYFCGVATATIVLNTLNITPPNDPDFGNYTLFTQDNLFLSEAVKSAEIKKSDILGHGLTLKKLAKLLHAFPEINTKTYFDNTVTELEFEKIVVKALASKNHLVIVNILRTALGEVGGGHFSLISAYDKKSNSVLFMDVASYKYGPTWISLKDLYQGMHTKDGNSYRGFIVVSQ